MTREGVLAGQPRHQCKRRSMTIRFKLLPDHNGRRHR